MILTKVQLPLFKSTGYVFYDCEMKHAAAWIKANLRGYPDHWPQWLKDHNDSPPLGVTLSHIGKSSCYIMWLQKNPDTNDGVSTLAHEASHAAFRVLTHYGIDIVEQSEEMHATITGYIVEVVLKAQSRRLKLRRKRRKGKRKTK